MEILEGVKVSKDLLEEVLSNPRFTFGFETEFFIEAVGNKLRPVLLQDVVDHPYGIGKKLQTLSWADVLSYFQYVGPKNDLTNYENIRIKLRETYVRIIRNDDPESVEVRNNRIPPESPGKMFKFVRSKYAPHQLMVLLRIYPKNGFVGLTEEQQDDLRRMVQSDSVESITPYGKVNSLTYFIGIDENDLDIDFMDDLGTRELAYTYVSESFSEILREPVNHTIAHLGDIENKYLTRGYTEWGLSPDLSLTGESENRIGAELVSPVKQIRQGMESLVEVISQMRSPRGPFKGIKFVTTPETGLHINLGIRGAEVDYVKLLMLLGDEYISRKFEREKETVAEPVIKILKKKGKLHDVRDVLLSIANRMTATTSDINIVHQYLEANVPKTKYTSINLNKLDSEGYIEFRSIGNRNYHMRLADIIQTVHRMAVIMQIATDPALYRKEFLTKLYKFVLEVAKEDHIHPHKDQDPLVASVGSIAHGTRGGYGVEAKPYIVSPFDGETWVDEYGVDFGSDTQ